LATTAHVNCFPDKLNQMRFIVSETKYTEIIASSGRDGF